MARTAVTVTDLLGAYGTYSANAADITWQAADTVNDQQVTLVEGDILLVWNQDAGAQTFTVTSVALFGRTGDVTAYSVGADEIAAYGPFRGPGWKQTDGMLYFEAASANIYFAILHPPSAS